MNHHQHIVLELILVEIQLKLLNVKQKHVQKVNYVKHVQQQQILHVLMTQSKIQMQHVLDIMGVLIQHIVQKQIMDIQLQQLLHVVQLHVLQGMYV
jgi:hypothetical protein